MEIFVAEIGDDAADDQLYRLTYDGQVADEHGYAVMGGAADVVAGLPPRALHRRRRRWRTALRLAVAALGHTEGERPGDPGRRTSRSRCSTAPAPSRASSPGSCGERLVALLGERGPEEPAEDDSVIADPTDSPTGSPTEADDEPPVAPPLA